MKDKLKDLEIYLDPNSMTKEELKYSRSLLSKILKKSKEKKKLSKTYSESKNIAAEPNVKYGKKKKK